MMALSRLIMFILVIFTTLLISVIRHSVAQDDRKTYIVYMGESPASEVSVSDHHVNMLQNIVGSDTATESLLHSYKRSFNGFAARLTNREAQQMAEKEGVVSVFASGKQELHTTRSWDFVGFSKNVERSTVESDIIIGIIDTGIWPESDSFDDKGLGPPPAKWKGTCQVEPNFNCNNKIIGAKYYLSDGFFLKGENRTVRDTFGHGTHTASIAAGAAVDGAGLYGLASGTARGGVPSARLAVYKACWQIGCDDADILAAFDDAIADGVDVISVSFGSSQKDYFKSPIAIGAFHAMKKGVLTVTSAGNRGPWPMSLSNYSPWSLTVGATKMDRDFVTDVRTGDNKIYEGTSINTFDTKDKMFPIIYGGDAPNTTAGYDSSYSRYCFEEALDKNLVKGKLVFCDGTSFDYGPKAAGAVGVVAAGGALGNKLADTSIPYPTSTLGVEDSSKFYIYLNSTRKPSASILKSKERIDKLAPYVASYSSRGPNPVTPNIFKPDLVAPGTYILAAWPKSVSVSGFEEDKRKTAYNIQSGTSMACPHASAAAAYVKSFHPTWSPAAIKSALMTTATPMSSDINPDAEFAYGAGQINPSKSPYPGLVYDIDEADYINFLCGQGYTNKLIQIVTGNRKSSCPKIGHDLINLDLNYPAFVLSASPSESINHVFNRTVTNVGSPTSTYKASIFAQPGLKITVSPSVISFSSLGEKRSYAVTVQGTTGKKIVTSASLVWDDGTYQVRSPIIIYVPI